MRRRAAFALVHRTVRRGEHLAHAGAAVVEHRDPDAGARAQTASVRQRDRRLAHQLGHLLGHEIGLLGLHMREQHAELVAAQPGHAVDLARAPPKRGRDRPQQRVAGGVAVLVVDALEAVDVDHQQRGVLAEAPAALELRVDVALEAAPVVHEGQRVALRVAAQPLLGELARRAVQQAHDGMARGAVLVADDRGAGGDPDRVPVRVADARVHLVSLRAALDEIDEGRLVHGGVVGVGQLADRPTDELVRGVAGAVGEGRVDALDASVHADHAHADRRQIEGVVAMRRPRGELARTASARVDPRQRLGDAHNRRDDGAVVVAQGLGEHRHVAVAADLGHHARDRVAGERLDDERRVQVPHLAGDHVRRATTDEHLGAVSPGGQQRTVHGQVTHVAVHDADGAVAHLGEHLGHGGSRARDECVAGIETEHGACIGTSAPRP